MSDGIGPLNTLFLSLILSAGSMLVLWPVSTTLGPLVTFVIINGAANRGFFCNHADCRWKCFWLSKGVCGNGNDSDGMDGRVFNGLLGNYVCSRKQKLTDLPQGAPIAGYMLNAYRKDYNSLTAYHPAIFYAGSMALGASGLVGFVRLKINRNVSKRV
jgi:hypothetical protein